MNPMREIRIEKLTLNIGTGRNEDKLKKAKKLLERITGAKVVETITKKRIPSWNVRPGLPLGCKTTIRGAKTEELLKRLLAAKENKLKESCFDNYGNVSFGLEEYINIPGLKYDPDLGMLGLQVSVTLERPGFRIKKRRLNKTKIPKRHEITKEDAVQFMKKKFGIEVN